MALIAVPDNKKLIMNSLTLLSPTQTNRSIWTSRSQSIGLPGAEMWSITATLDTMVTEAEERPWRAFIFNLRGGQNHFHFPLCKQCHIGPRPVVATGASDGYGIPLEGMTPSTRILEAGQYITVPLPSGHYRTCMLTTDLITNALGRAIVPLNIALGEAPTGGTIVETAKPFIPVKIDDPNVAMEYEGSTSTSSLELVEAL